MERKNINVRRNILQGLVFFALTILCLSCSLQADSKTVHFEPGRYEEYLLHDGFRRTYILHIPPQYDSRKKFPMVLLFHGGGGNSRQALDSYGLKEKANKEGFILVVPNGTGRLRNRFLTWNVGFGFGYAMKNNIDDIGFVRKLIEKLEEELKIDSKKVFATGISNGGILCHFLAANLSDKIAAIAPVVATVGGKRSINEQYILPPQPDNPVSVIAFNGFLDKHIPCSGGAQKRYINKPVFVKSVEEMHSFWIKANQCNTTPQIEVNEDKEYKKIVYAQGINNSEVVQYLIFNQGHAWPGAKESRPGADAPSKNVNTTDLMWDFFKRHHHQ